MEYTGKLNLKKPEGTDTVNIDDFNDNADILDAEVTKKSTPSQDGRMSKEDKAKLDGIEQGANKYTHPTNHPPSIITQDADNRFFTDAERTKLSGIETGANKYTHPSSHPASMITESTTRRFVSDAEKAEWDGKADGEHTHTPSQVGLGNVDNVKQASKQEFDAHKADEVHQGEVHGMRTNTNKELEYFDGEEWKPSHYKWTPPDDTSGSPGSDRLIAGTIQAGFFGEVSASELMNGTQLASAVGLSSGTAQHSNEPYLKFAYEGKIQFVAKKTYRYGLSWDQINSAGVVFGKNVTIGGLTYKVRLMRGAENDPSNYTDADRDAIGSEWNKLMLPIHENAPNNWAYPDYGGMSENWGIDYTDADLLTHNTHGNGSYSWCQETRGDDTTVRVYRGGLGVSNSGSGTSSGTVSNTGWRPVLELI